MCGMEIETAVRERIPVTIIVLNNSIMTGYNKYLPVAMEKYGIGKLSRRLRQAGREPRGLQRTSRRARRYQVGDSARHRAEQTGSRRLDRVYGRPVRARFSRMRHRYPQPVPHSQHESSHSAIGV